MGLKKEDSADVNAFGANLMSKKIIDIKSADDMIDLLIDNDDINIVFDFWADWCGPCKIFEPTFEKLQQEFSDDFIFARVNIENNSEIAQQYRISSVPTLLFVKNLNVRIKLSGVLSYDKLIRLLNKLRES